MLYFGWSFNIGPRRDTGMNGVPGSTHLEVVFDEGLDSCVIRPPTDPLERETW